MTSISKLPCSAGISSACPELLGYSIGDVEKIFRHVNLEKFPSQSVVLRFDKQIRHEHNHLGINHKKMDAIEGAAAGINTYHCICTTLILATPYNLESLPTRRAPATDQCQILPLSADSEKNISESRLHNITNDRKAIIIRKEDGFEKRILVRCDRCHLVVGYRIEGDATASNAIYLMPGGLVSTEAMKQGDAASGSVQTTTTVSA